MLFFAIKLQKNVIRHELYLLLLAELFGLKVRLGRHMLVYSVGSSAHLFRQTVEGPVEIHPENWIIFDMRFLN